ncbi:nitroreductase [Giesbergeria anulus]|uniref:Nitroreductase n=1 Tax=Giesbergeria anulus TaxID=180197 RepID=A0A1H9PG41_9BURK|nr:nitroreductase [Giesbergeria anulus]SER47181.1 Nitroreductase [Giesbergeria anulus]
MDISQALQQRRSVRAFLPQAPSAVLVHEILESAACAASGGNLQPWRVIALTGDSLAQVLQAASESNPQEYAHSMSYPANLWEPYRSRRFANGEALYRTLDIPREDKAARLQQLAKNAQFFGAPVGIFVCIDERMGDPQWMDVGLYLQSLMLQATANGLATCAQGFWRKYTETLREPLALPQPYTIACGVALGYEDTTAPINTLVSGRAPFEEWATMRGF